MKTAAIFDLDHTLLPVNSGFWAGYDLYKRSKLPLLGLVRVLGAALAYRFARIDFDQLVQLSKNHLVSMSKQELSDWGHTFVTQSLLPKILADAKKTLTYHQKLGHCLVLATSSIEEIAIPLAAALGMDEVVANRCLYDDKGQLTYSLAKPYCFGQGKLQRVVQLAKEKQLNLDESYFYSDSIVDVPLLQRVKFPQVVNPDWRLRLYAKTKQWPTFTWR